MLVAVTGGTGLVGRYLLRELIGEGYKVRAWHRPTSDLSGLAKLSSHIDWLPGQLGDLEATRKLVEGASVVVHAALDWDRSQGRRSPAEGNLLPFLETNLMGSLRLFESSHEAGVKRFIFISTCAVHEVIRDDRPLDETHPLWPTSHYGAHKAALEKFVHSYGLGMDWPICALRPTGIYGVNHPVSASRYYDLVGKVIRGDPIQSPKGGKEVHARDVARAVKMLMTVEEDQITGQAFNCYDRYIAEQEVAQIAKEISGSKSEIADLNRGPKHQIETERIRSLGMTFGGEELLEQTVEELVKAHQE